MVTTYRYQNCEYSQGPVTKIEIVTSLDDAHYRCRPNLRVLTVISYHDFFHSDAFGAPQRSFRFPRRPLGGPLGGPRGPPNPDSTLNPNHKP